MWRRAGRGEYCTKASSLKLSCFEYSLSSKVVLRVDFELWSSARHVHDSRSHAIPQQTCLRASEGGRGHLRDDSCCWEGCVAFSWWSLSQGSWGEVRWRPELSEGKQFEEETESVRRLAHHRHDERFSAARKSLTMSCHCWMTKVHVLRRYDHEVFEWIIRISQWSLLTRTSCTAIERLEAETSVFDSAERPPVQTRSSRWARKCRVLFEDQECSCRDIWSIQGDGGCSDWSRWIDYRARSIATYSDIWWACKRAREELISCFVILGFWCQGVECKWH